MSSPSRSEKPPAPASPVPRGGVVAMVTILTVMGLLSVYSNVQKWRRDKIETVTSTPAASPIPDPSATPTSP